MDITIYTDGGSRGNPGKAATGFVISGLEEPITSGQYLGETTNNVAEYTAILQALTETYHRLNQQNADPAQVTIHLYLDSQLAQRQITRQYKIKNPTLKTLVQQIWNIQEQFAEVAYIHVKRHLNKKADAMVNHILDKQS